MPLAARDSLYLFSLEVRDLDRQTLPQKIAMTKLPELSASPGIDFSLVREGHGVTLPARDVDHDMVADLTDWPDGVLIHYAPMAQLSIDTSTPREDCPLVIDGGCMVVPKG